MIMTFFPQNQNTFSNFEEKKKKKKGGGKGDLPHQLCVWTTTLKIKTF